MQREQQPGLKHVAARGAQRVIVDGRDGSEAMFANTARKGLSAHFQLPRDPILEHTGNSTI